MLFKFLSFVCLRYSILIFCFREEKRKKEEEKLQKEQERKREEELKTQREEKQRAVLLGFLVKSESKKVL